VQELLYIIKSTIKLVYILNGTYNIQVGNGGLDINCQETQSVNNGRANGDVNGFNGNNSQFIKTDGTKNYLAIGGAGGHGGGIPSNNTRGSSGGRNYGFNNQINLLTPNNFFNNSAVSIVGGNSYNNSGLVSPEGCRGNLGGDQIENRKGGGGGGQVG